MTAHMLRPPTLFTYCPSVRRARCCLILPIHRPILGLFIDDPAEWLRSWCLAVTANIDHANLTGGSAMIWFLSSLLSSPVQRLNFERLRIDPNKESDVEVDREAQERGDVSAIPGCSLCEGREYEAESDFMRVLGVDAGSAVVGEARVSAVFRPKSKSTQLTSSRGIDFLLVQLDPYTSQRAVHHRLYSL